MPDTVSASTLVRAFHDPSDGEALKSRDLILLLLECSTDPFSRRQFTPGHITCTGLVLASDRRRLLLVHHRRLDRWLLPGGHIEPADATLADAARREVLEETGALLRSDLEPHLAGVVVHGIPPGRGEPYHLHHDLIFAFQAASDQISLSDESHAVAWCGPEEFDRYAVPQNVRRAWERYVLPGAAPEFRGR
jgi:8-oxo-dGTP pyrophosphatase MutT (NUDIX family)